MNTTARPTRTAPGPGTVQDVNYTQQNGPLVTNEPQKNQQNLALPSATPRKVYPAKLAKAILAVTKNVNPVAKAGWNDFHKYAYRKWEDVFEELVPVICDQGLILQQSEIAHGGFAGDLIEISYDFTILNEDGDVWPDRPQITAICKVRDSKGVLDDKAASKCHTQAQKYFYTSFFKIRTDTSEADHDAGERPKPRRTAPNPDGTVAPHFIPIVAGEHPQAWANRFEDLINKHAKKPEDIDQWYASNKAVFDKLQGKPEYQETYDYLIDVMDKRTLQVAPKADPISSGPQQGNGGFPGDTKMEQAQPRRAAPAPDLGIPVNLDRQLDEKEKEWLISLSDAYNACETAAELVSEHESIMLPSQGSGSISPHAWSRAVALTKKHLERVQNS